jgi:hypothetical protein
MRRYIETAHQLARLIYDMKMMPKPFTATFQEGKHRTDNQNALAFKWYNEAANWLGDTTAADVRAECKLYIGVRMLVTENEAYREKWHKYVLNHYTPVEKLGLMLEPYAYPVTSAMNTKQMSKYMDSVYQKYAEQGVPLTDPELMKYQ